MSGLSFAHKLPPELWLRIFMLIIQNSQECWTDAYEGYPVSLYTTPFTLSVICRPWRAICVDNSALWHSVYLQLPPYRINPRYNAREDELDADRDLLVTDQFIARVDAFETWIERAGDQKLSIALRLEDKNTSLSFGKQHALRIPSIIVAHANQVEELDIALSAKWYPMFNKLEFPLLKALKLWIPEMWPVAGYFDSWAPDLRQVPASLDLSACPQLTSIRIDGSYQDHSRIILPWAQIHDSHTTCMRPPVYREILDLMPNIRQCIIEAGEYEDYFSLEGDSDDIDMFVSTGRRDGEWALESLTIHGFEVAVIQAFLDHSPLTLRRISLHPVYPSRSPSLDSTFLSSLQPFSATLQSLSVGRYLIKDFDYLLRTLGYLTSLVSLDLNVGHKGRGIDDDFLYTFTAPSFLPRLKRLFIRSSTFRFQAKALLGFLRSRGYGPPVSQRPVAKIRDVNFVAAQMDKKASRVLSAEELGEVVEMKQKGLNIIVEYLSPNGGFDSWYQELHVNQS